MEYKFIAQKMIDRVKEEGREEMLTPETLEKIKSLDGAIGTDYNWRSVVHDEKFLVWLEDKQTYVNKRDCEIV